MKVSTKKKAEEALKYLEELGLLIWELNQKSDNNEDTKELAEKMNSLVTHFVDTCI